MVIKEFIKELKQCHSMFHAISERALMESLQVFRTFELREGESASIGGFHGDLLFVVIGRVGVDGGKKELTPGDTLNKPLLLPELPKLLTITAIEDSWLCHLDVDTFSYLSGLEETFDDIRRGAKYDAALLDKMRLSTAFRRLPIEYIEDAVKSITEVDVKAGEEIISDGKDIKAFYVLAEGRAEVLRLNPESGEIEKTEELGPGDEIGEEAIIMAAKSPCTVKMLEDGCVYAMDVQMFREILQKPLLAEVAHEVAVAMYKSGIAFIDVRFVEEYDEAHIVGCVNIPLFDLMKRRAEFDTGKQYVVYCRSGRRSAVAAFKLKQLNINAVSLKGGIKAWPYNDLLEPVS
ncbi:cyclic nucleotide-binding domain-containing protein [Candidatus Magnetominusculus xianensis]|uniref:Rhodanese Homology Domain (RHOD)-containing protein n=1 Tax=Candidatus Magnetominusculus xianensis TaxID=1748249 RepID=A0ABR5SFR2_9BACT|nr:cyclic nucleotide-binding domain-containing protein [Candidatus Magnetominusculus xianensis]KWT86799.1 Rhodanese Homology Domain (RHOD)-containing protein [Candidatus Magnetominusculus xianensis]MBF0402483.1 cyclic nucleotide-binding domain-containing protein [Nitrospirota bacterium]